MEDLLMHISRTFSAIFHQVLSVYETNLVLGPSNTTGAVLSWFPPSAGLCKPLLELTSHPASSK